MSLIEVNNLTKVYKSEGLGTHALRGVSFNIKQGEFVAIMGASGSGKSTLLHILGFLDRHSDGEYNFEGKNFDDYSEKELAHLRNQKMGFVFQAFNLLPRTSVIDNIKLPLLYSKVPQSKWHKIALKAVKAVNLKHRLGSTPAKLSGGEKQRTAIARALVNDPSVIFADEPTGNLDTTTSHQIMEFLKELNGAGRTIILITHEDDIARYAKRIIKLKDGTIEKDSKS